MATRPTGRGTGTAGAALAALLLAGCSNVHSIKVGSVPDDYRTNHPIVVSERDVTADIPVGINDRGMNRVQKVAVDGFIADYDRAAAAMVTVMVPSGSANAAAAHHVAGEIIQRLHAGGVKRGHVLHQPYEASAYGATAPIRLVYPKMTAGVPEPCGRWPDDLSNNTENRHWANFGCSYQNNLAAQIANPADLLGPRKPSEIDTERRSVSIDDYRVRESVFTPETGY